MRFQPVLSIRTAVTTALVCVGVYVGAYMVTAGAEPGSQQPRTAAQLEQLVAPIALYPDSLLSQVLMASTYPLEVVEAARWSQANAGVSGQALEDAMQKQSWDPSVKALTSVPQTLQMMNDKLDWTRQLGDVFLAQQPDVLAAVQRLRARADNAGYLKTTEQQKVTKVAAAAQGVPQGPAASPQTIPPGSSAAPAYVYTIESAIPDTYYLPIYDPNVVYGAWPYPDYEPYAWYPPGYYAGGAFAFATAAVVGAAIWGNIDWRRNRVDIDVNRFNRFNRTNIANGNWAHNPAHRGGVPYGDRNLAQRFGDQGRATSREAFRGKADAGRRDLAKQGGAGKAGQKGGSAAKGGAGPKQGASNVANAKNAKNAKNAGSGKKAGGGQQARAKQGAGQARAKQGGGQARSKQVARPKQAARSHQASRQRPSGANSARAQHRPSAGHRGGGGMRAAGGGGRGGGGRGGGGRRSDVQLKHDIVLLGRLNNGLGFYRFAYNGSSTAYVGVMAQEVQTVMPAAVVRGRDGYLRVHYDKLGVSFQTYDQWMASGARIPVVTSTPP